MSQIQSKINTMLAQANFLIQHQELLELWSASRQEELWVEAHDGDLPSYSDFPHINVYESQYDIEFTVCGPAEEQKRLIVLLRRAFGGKWDKDDRGDQFVLGCRFNEDLKIEITADRESVCTKKVVGTRTRVFPAIEARPEETVEEDVVEYECGPLLAGAEVV